MSRPLLHRIFARLCSHEFAWPRLAADGSHYQVCALCGDQYAYDWKSMQRLQRLDALVTAMEPGRQDWKPRARRLTLDAPGQARVAGTEPWIGVTVVNVSHTGALISGLEARERQHIELVFEMPREISGHAHCRVLFKGMVVRIAGERLCGVAMESCEYLHDRRQPISIEVGGSFGHSRLRMPESLRRKLKR